MFPLCPVMAITETCVGRQRSLWPEASPFKRHIALLPRRSPMARLIEIQSCRRHKAQKTPADDHESSSKVPKVRKHKRRSRKSRLAREDVERQEDETGRREAIENVSQAIYPPEL